MRQATTAKVASVTKTHKNKQEQNEFERERERMHRQMLSSVSHDLKTPLSAIIGSLEIFGRMKHLLSEEKSTMLIGTALQEAYRLDNFITNILDMAKLENGMMKLRQEPCTLQGVVQDCLERLGNRREGIQLNVAVPEAIQFTTDPMLFCRTISLLLDNAIKHAATNPEITLEGQKIDGHVVLRIMDNGNGIPDAKLEEIFSKYTRLMKLDHQNAGTGLGLSICRAIMSLLGGEIMASNRPEGGAVFTLRLPIH